MSTSAKHPDDVRVLLPASGPEEPSSVGNLAKGSVRSWWRPSMHSTCGAYEAGDAEVTEACGGSAPSKVVAVPPHNPAHRGGKAGDGDSNASDSWAGKHPVATTQPALVLRLHMDLGASGCRPGRALEEAAGGVAPPASASSTYAFLRRLATGKEEPMPQQAGPGLWHCGQGSNDCWLGQRGLPSPSYCEAAAQAPAKARAAGEDASRGKAAATAAPRMGLQGPAQRAAAAGAPARAAAPRLASGDSCLDQEPPRGQSAGPG